MSGHGRKNKRKSLQRRPRYVLNKEQRYSQMWDRESGEAEAVDERPLPFPVAMWTPERCISKNSTCSKLVKRSLTKRLRLKTRFPGLCLTMLGRKYVTPMDREIVKKYGCAVMDCSWSRVHDAPFGKIRTAHPRILPYLVSVDPSHYGKSCELNCVEAIASCLIITGFWNEAMLFLDKFTWGCDFLNLNGALLEKYALCANSKEIVGVQDEYLMNCRREKIEQRSKVRPDFPQSDTESKEDEEEEDRNAVSEITEELVNVRI